MADYIPRKSNIELYNHVVWPIVRELVYNKGFDNENVERWVYQNFDPNCETAYEFDDWLEYFKDEVARKIAKYVNENIPKRK